MARKEFAVFGLGEFGRSVALTLAKNGCEVMAIDSSSEKVQDIADSVTHAVKADATDMDVVRSLGLNNLDAAVIAIGNNLEASIAASPMCLPRPAMTFTRRCCARWARMRSSIRRKPWACARPET